MATNRKVQLIKHFELKTADLDRTDDIESKAEQARAVITRLEQRFRQTRGHQANTENILFDLLRNLNERIAALENAQGSAERV
jgi:hypothetical protein